jgi:hypothetical protein
MHSQPDQPRRGGGRRIAGEQPGQPGQPDQAGAPERHPEMLQQYLEAVRQRAEAATSWLSTSRHFAELLNRDGVVPVTARFTASDLAFLASAREELLRFAELGLRLAQLHQPQEVSPLISDPASQFQRCGSCMWRWPCPTFRLLDELLTGLEPT